MLKPCPCCEAAAEMRKTAYGAAYVICPDCKLQTPFLPSAKEAEARWNRRRRHRASQSKRPMDKKEEAK